jgi:hypothetical protein
LRLCCKGCPRLVLRCSRLWFRGLFCADGLGRRPVGARDRAAFDGRVATNAEIRWIAFDSIRNKTHNQLLSSLRRGVEVSGAFDHGAGRVPSAMGMTYPQAIVAVLWWVERGPFPCGAFQNLTAGRPWSVPAGRVFCTRFSGFFQDLCTGFSAPSGGLGSFPVRMRWDAVAAECAAVVRQAFPGLCCGAHHREQSLFSASLCGCR